MAGGKIGTKLLHTEIIHYLYGRPLQIWSIDTAWAVSQAPIAMMTRALAAGRSCPHAPPLGIRWPSWLPFTKRSPTVVSTAVSPRLKATTSTTPRGVRLASAYWPEWLFCSIPARSHISYHLIS